jgi:predicted acylesterase/phospholipase RssA
MTALVLGGGGARGFGHLGAVKRLKEIPGFVVDEIHGTSAGAIFGAGLAGGHEPDEMLDFATSLKPSEFMKFNWQFLWRVGLFGIDLKKTLAPWAPKTFGDAEVPFTVYATGAQNGEHLVYSTELTPDLPCYKGVEASGTFPLFFRTTRVKGVSTWDGGIWNSLAVDQPQSKDVVAIRLQGDRPPIRPWKWYPGAIRNLVELLLDALDREHIEDAAYAKVITLKLPISTLGFNKLDADMVRRLFEIGYETVDKKLASGWDWRES